MKDIFALAFGSMIGWGWVVLTGGWVETGGWLGACLAFVIGAVLCVFVGLCFAELTPALPCAGGNMVFSYRALGYGGSWIAVWATAFAYLGVAAWEGIAIATAINYVVPIPSIGYLWTIAGYDVYMSWCAVGMIIGLVIVLINFFGGKAAVLFQTVTTVLLVIVGLIFFLGAMGLGDASYMGPAFINSKGFIGVILMTPAMFVGFDVIPQSAEEMNIPRKKFPTVLILSILMATLWYIAIILGVAKAAPPEIIAGAEVGVADAAAFVFNTQIMGKIVIIGALCGILTSWNGFIIGAVRVLFAMGRAKMLPPIFGKLHSKYKTPYASIILVGILCLSGPLLGANALVWFVNASAFGTVLNYLMVSISFVVLRRKEPDLPRPYAVPAGRLMGPLAIIVSVAFIALYFPPSPGHLVWPYEWGMLLFWAVLGVILAIITKYTYRNVSLEEREHLIFGEEYARDLSLRR